LNQDTKSFFSLRKSMFFQFNKALEETVLLIHGWAGSRKIWRDLVPILAPSLKVIEVDLWGHGDSLPPSKKINKNTITSDLLNVIEKSGSTDCYVVAHSMGCAIALCLAKFAPQIIKGLVLIEGLYPLKEMFASKGRSIDDKNRRKIFEEMLFPYYSQQWAKELIDEMMLVPEETLHKYNDFLSIDRVDLAKKIKCPYAIISREKYRGRKLDASLWKNLGLDNFPYFCVRSTETHFVLQENPQNAINAIMEALKILKSTNDKNLKELTGAFFSSQAEMYFSSSMHAQEKLDEIVNLSKPSKNNVLLDLGCGAGHTSFALAPYVKEVIAYDFSDRMIEIVQREAKEKKIKNIMAVIGDVDSLPFSNSSFNRVTSRIAAHHFPNLSNFMLEVGSVLKRNGIFVLVDNIAPHDADLYVFADKMEKLKDSSHFHLYTETTWREVIAGAGLTIDYLKCYKSPHIFNEWTGVAGLDDKSIIDIENQFLKANKKIKNYFQIIIRNNKVKQFSIDRLIIRAKKN